jgi:hypothetical protein
VPQDGRLKLAEVRGRGRSPNSSRSRRRSRGPAIELLSRCDGPAGIRKASRTKLTEIAKPRAPSIGTRLVAQILTALDAQTVVVPRHRWRPS